MSKRGSSLSSSSSSSSSGKKQPLISSFFKRQKPSGEAATPAAAAPSRDDEEEEPRPPKRRTVVIDDDDDDDDVMITTAKAKKSSTASPEEPKKSDWQPSFEDDPGRRKALCEALSPLFDDGDDDEDKAADETTQQKGAGGAHTPLERQILDLMRTHPKTMLIIEVGYKFRVFGDDAVKAAKILGMVAWRDKNFMTCSFPTPRLGVHVRRLVAASCKVGVVLQTETAIMKKAGKSGKKSGTFTRGLSRTFSAATMLDDLDAELGLKKRVIEEDDDEDEPMEEEEQEGEPEEESNVGERWLWSASLRAGVVGVVAVELRSARCFLDAFPRDDAARLESALEKAPPTEALIGKSLGAEFEAFMTKRGGVKGQPWRLEVVDDQVDDLASGDSPIRSAAFACGTAATAALASLRGYLRSGKVESALDAVRLEGKALKKMRMDASTLADLEVLRASDGGERGSALRVYSRGTCTRGGVDLLREWLRAPLVDLEAIQERQTAVRFLMMRQESPVSGLTTLLDERSKQATLARSLEKPIAALTGRKMRPRRLLELLTGAERLIKALPTTVNGDTLLSRCVSEASREKEKVLKSLEAQRSILDAAGCADDDSSRALNVKKSDDDALKEAAGRLEAIDEELEQERRRLGKLLKQPRLEWKTMPTLKLDFLVELPKSHSTPESDWTMVSETKAVRRYHSATAAKLSSKRDLVHEELKEEALRAWTSFVEATDAALSGPLRRCLGCLSQVDALRSMAALAAEPGWNIPQFTQNEASRLHGFAHPTLPATRAAQKMLLEDPDSEEPNNLVTNDIDLKRGDCLCLTGPNMGGKSSTARAIALASVMAQVGGPISAAPETALRVYDAIFTRMGADDDLAAGKSTFLCELERAATALNESTADSLVILDELGRGTSTFDGLNIAGAVLDYLIDKVQCTSIFVTHYHDLATQAAQNHPVKLRNFHMAFQKITQEDGDFFSDEILMLYRLEPGLAQDSFGLYAAKLAGVPIDVLNLARKYAQEAEITIQQDTADEKF